MGERAHTKGRDRPILFSAPMVRALLDGRKTVTRRIMNPKFPSWVSDAGFTCFTPARSVSGRGTYIDDAGVDHGPSEKHAKLRYFKGDRLYVREAWRMPKSFDEYSPTIAATKVPPASRPNVFFEADGAVRSAGAATGEPGRIRAGMHMPRWASRLTLTVTDVRVQRLQDITEEDAIAEGVEPIVDHGVGNQHLHRIAFDQLWERIHGAGATYANPWVAAYTFTVERRNIDEGLGQRADATPKNPLPGESAP